MSFGLLGVGGFGSIGLLGGSGTASPTGIFNFNQAFLSQWRAAAAAVAAGSSDQLIVCGYGDSTTSGQGALKPSRVPPVLASLIKTAGFNAANEGYTTGGFPTAAIIDSNITIGAGWNFSAGHFTLGGRDFIASDFTSVLSYTPYNTVDTWDIGYLVTTAAGSFSVAVDGGAPITTINALGAGTSIAVATVTVPSGTHRLDIQAVTGTPSILDAIGRVAAQKQLKFYNGGTVGALVNTFISDGVNAYNPRPMLKTLAPKLSIINLTINDWVAATSTSSYTADLTNLILDGQASGDVLLMSGAPSAASSAPIATQLIYINIVKALAQSMNCAMLCLTDRWGSFLNKQSFYSDAAVHPNAAGYADIALGLSQILIPAANAAAVPTIFDNGHKGTAVTLSNGGLKATQGASAGIARSIASNSAGKFHAEFTVGAAAVAANNTIGIINAAGSLSSYVGSDHNSVGLAGSGSVFTNGALLTTILGFAVGNVVSVAVDFTNGSIWFRTNGGNWNNSGTANPATNTGGISLSTLNAGPYFAAVGMNASTDSDTANFGASAYSFTPPSGFGNWTA